MMQIHRLFATLVILGAAISVSSLARGESIRLRLTVDAGDSARINTPIVATLTAGKELSTDFVKAIESHRIWINLQPVDRGVMIFPQVEIAHSGDQSSVILRWVEQKLDANQSRQYDLALDAAIIPAAFKEFHFDDGERFRDLLFGKQPITRYMTPRYDPADASTTYKPYLQVYGMHDEGFITKGTGGLDEHHRGLFFGFHTQYGDFWHCHGGESQQHDRYLVDREFAGPFVARESSVTNWITKDGKSVARDTREVTAWRIAPDQTLLDFDITLQSLAGDLELGADAHHGGFHFRASQEVAGSETKRNQGKCTFVRPTSAKLVRDDIWSDTPWTAMLFPIHGNPYVVMLMDHPENPRPTQFSLRGYGRFGAYFEMTLPQDKPLHLRYRVLVMDGKANPNPTADQLAPRYQDFVAPPNVSVVGK